MNPLGEKKVHSLVDKIFKIKNLEVAWRKVKANRGSGGVDRVSIADFSIDLENNLGQLHEDLRSQTYQPDPVREHKIPKAGQPGKFRRLGIPTIRDRVCQQALVNRLEPIFEPIFDDASFGYRKGRSTHDALRKIWLEIENGNEWIVDADLQDFFGSVNHEKLITLINQRVSDGRVLNLIRCFLEAPVKTDQGYANGTRGMPQGGVASPLLSNILLTPFDKEMRARGINITRYADDWVATCRTQSEAEKVLKIAKSILEELGVTLSQEKTRIVHIRYGFEFLGFKLKRGKSRFQLPNHKIKSKARMGKLYAIPKPKSVDKFKDQVRALTRRRCPLNTAEIVKRLNPIIRGWGNYYCKAHVRKLFNQLDRWILRRIWSQRLKRWRNAGWKIMPRAQLYGEYGLVNLVSLIPSISQRKAIL